MVGMGNGRYMCGLHTLLILVLFFLGVFAKEFWKREGWMLGLRTRAEGEKSVILPIFAPFRWIAAEH